MTPIDVWVKDFAPFTRDELHWMQRLVEFLRDRQEEKQPGRIEFHADRNGVVNECSRVFSDRKKIAG